MPRSEASKAQRRAHFKLRLATDDDFYKNSLERNRTWKKQKYATDPEYREKVKSQQRAYAAKRREEGRYRKR